MHQSYRIRHAPHMPQRLLLLDCQSQLNFPNVHFQPMESTNLTHAPGAQQTHLAMEMENAASALPIHHLRQVPMCAPQRLATTYLATQWFPVAPVAATLLTVIHNALLMGLLSAVVGALTGHSRCPSVLPAQLGHMDLEMTLPALHAPTEPIQPPLLPLALHAHRELGQHKAQ